MDDTSVCTLLLAESDAQNNTSSTPNAASVTDAEKVINTKIDSSQVEGDQSEEELLKGLLTDDYCHVCEAVLLFESQRLSHYEGKKHAQKLKVYLQAKRAEKMNKAPQRPMTTDKDHFCELCNMVFSSHVVAKSHYEGKIHTKNLRKQGLQATDRHTDDADQKSAPEGDTEHLLGPTTTTATPSTEADLKDPNIYCALCVASFNNPQMALQHYNGRKHHRNLVKHELMKELGEDVQQANFLMCQMCGIQFTSVQMYQAHMQGSKHQTREKKVVDLCKSQQKDYNTFADELADYIQVQKARGITPKVGEGQKNDEEDEEEVEALNKGDIMELNKPNIPPTANPPHHSRPGYYPVERRQPPYQGPPWPAYGWDHTCPPVHKGPGPPPFTGRPTMRRRRRKQSSSSSYTTSSSYSSSYSSSTSDSDGSEHRRREKRRTRRSRRERDKRARDEDSGKEEKRRKRRRRERGKDSEERRRGESEESEEDRRRKKRKNLGKRRRREKKPREEDLEGGESLMDNVMPDGLMDNRKETEVHIQAEVNVEQGDRQDKADRPKYRKEKKKTKEKADTRTEEEKLWDDSILGC
ncbi:zinc finger matrin-type protein 1 [Centropristis striata]|uniref:zinc finger matrin-type protein 1 n=1 Tax=Centropristis striata TaxID=184440 RepID=UPI0027E0A639|nr:zinc finger matrin-type protein 1 [Centropristis striata]